jgi:hypothetical protein
MFTVRELARSQGFPDSFKFYAVANRVETVSSDLIHERWLKCSLDRCTARLAMQSHGSCRRRLGAPFARRSFVMRATIQLRQPDIGSIGGRGNCSGMNMHSPPCLSRCNPIQISTRMMTCTRNETNAATCDLYESELLPSMSEARKVHSHPAQPCLLPVPSSCPIVILSASLEYSSWVIDILGEGAATFDT